MSIRTSSWFKGMTVLLFLLMVPGLTMAGDFKTVEPVQFSLGGRFEVGDTNLQDGVAHPRSFVIPEGARLLIRYVSCQALVVPDTTVYIHFLVEHGEAPALSLIPTARSQFTTGQDRIAATVNTEIYLGISPTIGPELGNEITVYGQRETDVGGGLLSCSLSGELSLP